MEHPFFPTTTNRVEALRWLSIAEKLLLSRDLAGCKSFATRARDSDPTLSPAEQVLAIVDTLIAAERRIGNNQVDWYGVLRLAPQQGQDGELVGSHYRNLALLLNPQNNRFPLADEAFRLVFEAWSVLSNPARKNVFDKEVFNFAPQQQQQQQHDPFSNPMQAAMHQNFFFFGGNSGGVSHPPPQMHTGIHFPQVQVHASTHVEPVVSDSVRQPQNFMNFTSGSTLSFGSGIKSTHETVSERLHVEDHRTFVSNAAPVPVPVPVPVSVSAPTPASNSTPFPVPTPAPAPSPSPVPAPARTPAPAAAQTPIPAPAQAEASAPAPVMDLGPAPVAMEERVNSSYRKKRTARFGDSVASSNVGQYDNSGQGENAEVRVDEQDEEIETAVNEGSSFWTACPYCYYMYEYPNVYIDCTLKCQNCRRAFQGVVIPSPPPVVEGQNNYFCCWGFMPLGCSLENWNKNKKAASSWTPFSPMFSFPQTANTNSGSRLKRSSAPRVYYDDDDDLIDVSNSSESDDLDWNGEMDGEIENTNSLKSKGASVTPNKGSKKAKSDKAKDVNLQDGVITQNGVETSNKVASESNKKGPSVSSRKQPGRVAKNYGRLDLNVEFSNEPEEQPVHKAQEGPATAPSRGEDDNIEGIGFFEGLDEFLSSLPILNVVGDDKVVKP